MTEQRPPHDENDELIVYDKNVGSEKKKKKNDEEKSKRSQETLRRYLILKAILALCLTFVIIAGAKYAFNAWTSSASLYEAELFSEVADLEEEAEDLHDEFGRLGLPEDGLGLGEVGSGAVTAISYYRDLDLEALRNGFQVDQDGQARINLHTEDRNVVLQYSLVFQMLNKYLGEELVNPETFIINMEVFGRYDQLVHQKLVQINDQLVAVGTELDGVKQLFVEEELTLVTELQNLIYEQSIIVASISNQPPLAQANMSEAAAYDAAIARSNEINQRIGEIVEDLDFTTSGLQARAEVVAAAGLTGVSADFNKKLVDFGDAMNGLALILLGLGITGVLTSGGGLVALEVSQRKQPDAARLKQAEEKLGDGGDEEDDIDDETANPDLSIANKRR